MPNKFELPADKESLKTYLDSEDKRHEMSLGRLGAFLFGSNPNTQDHIMGFLAFFILLGGFIFSLVPDSIKGTTTMEFWKTLTPTLTTLIGYLAGKGSKK